MRTDHRREIAALAAVVRAALDDLAAHRTVPGDALAALARVEAWLDGADVDAASLQAAADASHEEGIPPARRESDRALLWARTAAGNLAWAAGKPRGWQTAHVGIVDAASYALSSLGVAGTRDRDALEVVRAAASAAATAPSRRSAEPRRPKVDLTAWIGAAAMKRLARRSPMVDPEARGDEVQLRACLAERGYAAHPSVLVYDARYGGLVVADSPGEAGRDWLFGAYACLRSGAHPSLPTSAGVPIAFSPNDEVFFMGEGGEVSGIDTLAEVAPTSFAPDGDAMMRRLFGDG